MVLRSWVEPIGEAGRGDPIIAESRRANAARLQRENYYNERHSIWKRTSHILRTRAKAPAPKMALALGWLEALFVFFMDNKTREVIVGHIED